MWQMYAYENADGRRPYFVYTPERYRPGREVPLLVMLHGCKQMAQDFAAGTGMNKLAEQNGFIVLYPQQTRNYNLNRCWNWYNPGHQGRGAGEPASIAGIIQAIVASKEKWTIDPRRIYVAGMSAGGAMAVILGATYPDLIAAIGVHSGVEYQGAGGLVEGLRVMHRGGPDPLQQGKRAYKAMGSFSRLVPTIVFHGTDDKVVVPVNGDQVVQQWMQTDKLASGGAYTARLEAPSRVTSAQVPGGYPYLVSTWGPHAGDTVQAYWKVGGMGHAWSGGDPKGTFTDWQGPSASLAMYQFFMAHPLSARGPEKREKKASPRRLLARLRDFWRARVHA
jgi:poly(hydroxyalkanoate) depolymerase family esterase